jgi:DNA-binding LacI/PurR family transcriptional regulator
MADRAPAQRASAPTLESVAAEAGVSRGTASRVLSGSRQVSERARTEVLAAAERLGYVPNLAARALVTRRSDSVAFVVAESEERFFADPFFATVLRGAHTTMSRHGRQVIFVVLASAQDRTRFERFAGGGHIDGALFVSLHGPDRLPSDLAFRGVPVVTMGRPYRPGDPTPYVDADNVGGARLATRAMLERGRKTVTTITGPPDMAPSVDRLDGFRAELAAHGRRATKQDIAVGDFSVASGERAMRHLLERRPDLDGVFAANDLMAVGAMQVLAASGRSVPDDVAVVGFDDVPVAAALRPALTTVRQPLVRMGEEMARVLVDALEGRPVGPPVVLPTELVVREST